MSPEERQAALNNISAEDLAKIQEKNTNKTPVYEEDLVYAEVLDRWGWNAYVAIRNDEPLLVDALSGSKTKRALSSKELMTLLAASRKLDLLKQYMAAQASLIGAGSAQSKSPSKTFTSMTKKILDKVEADV